MTGIAAPTRLALTLVGLDMPPYSPNRPIMQANSAVKISMKGAISIMDGNSWGSVDKKMSSSMMLLIMAILIVSFMAGGRA